MWLESNNIINNLKVENINEEVFHVNRAYHSLSVALRGKKSLSIVFACIKWKAKFSHLLISQWQGIFSLHAH